VLAPTALPSIRPALRSLPRVHRASLDSLDHSRSR
jgi:hypothetical protein